MEIDPWTLTLQAVNFLVLVWLLHRFLYRPVLAMIARRQEAIDGAYAEAAARDAAAKEKLDEYEARLADIDRERHRTLDDAHRQADAERAATLADTSAERERMLAAARAEIEGMHAAAADAEARWAVDTAVSMARRLLAEGAGGVDPEPLLNRAWDRLEALPAERQEELRRALSDSGNVEIVTAPALDAAARGRAAARLGEWAGNGAEPEFGVDDGLILGAELRFPHAVVGASWRDALDAARTELAKNDDPD